MLVGATDADSWATDGGEAFLFYGAVSGSLTVDDADACFTPAAPRDFLGHAFVAHGDEDGDGLPDLWVGVIGADTNGQESGAALLFSGAGL